MPPRPIYPIRSGSGHATEPKPRMIEIVIDGDQDLWVRYTDCSWRWISLGGFIDLQVGLDEPDVFSTAHLDEHSQQIYWVNGVMLSARALVRMPLQPSKTGVLVMAAGSEPQLWFRPLATRGDMLWTSGQTQNRQIGLLHDLLSPSELAQFHAAYRTSAEAVDLRLLDLLHLRNVAALGSLEQVLRAKWVVPGSTSGSIETVLTAILRGEIQNVEFFLSRPVLTYRILKDEFNNLTMVVR